METVCNEVLDRILDNLPIEAKQEARQVCHKWRDVVDYRMNFHVPFNDETFKSVIQSETVITNLILQDFKTALSISSSRFGFTKRVQSVTVESLVNKSSIHLLKNCTEIKELRFCAGALMSPNSHTLRLLKFDNLTELTLSFRQSHWKQSKAFAEFGQSVYLPSMKSLFLDWDCVSTYDSKLFVEDYMTMFDLIGKHYRSLRVLKMKVPQAATLLDQDSINYEPVKIQVMIERLNQVTLEQLSIRFFDFEGNIPFNLGCYLLRCQRKLQTLVVCGTMFQCVEEAIIQSSETLVSLGIVPDLRANFNCDLLKDCKNLEILEIFTPLRSETLNIHRIPLNVTNFFHKGPLSNENIIWVSENMKWLKEVSFINPQGNSYYFSISMLIAFIRHTNVEKICVWSHCNTQEIEQFCHAVPGLIFLHFFHECSQQVHLVSISIDRKMLNFQ